MKLNKLQDPRHLAPPLTEEKGSEEELAPGSLESNGEDSQGRFSQGEKVSFSYEEKVTRLAANCSQEKMEVADEWVCSSIGCGNGQIKL